MRTATGSGMSRSPLRQRRTIRSIDAMKSRAAPSAPRPRFRWTSCDSSARNQENSCPSAAVASMATAATSAGAGTALTPFRQFSARSLAASARVLFASVRSCRALGKLPLAQCYGACRVVSMVVATNLRQESPGGGMNGRKTRSKRRRHTRMLLGDKPPNCRRLVSGCCNECFETVFPCV